ncbi:YitT family protein [Alicyclobacillus ferrooxydans]|uniref:Uncharacterized protein n=1 Tax=Alicyclobacillus ferrooxydans TaxID=471514 RepID=A0A0P9CH03_9BACL|nr:YitT family protein [Alicyclobacillus ferrooxydans]KPV42313.1 hypothetical protein AN477_18625 [Alicyclobacillus ferrooxydans]
MAAVSVLIERDSHISSGGVSGLSIGIADYLHLSAGIVNLSVKLGIFGFIFILGGKSTGFWTVVAAGITGIAMWVFEQLPLDLDLPKWIAFVTILLFAKLPIGLLVSKGYSTGGFTAIGQILQARTGIPLRISLLILNLMPALAMLTAHGLLSGALTATIALSSGVATEAWTNLTRRVLDGHTMPCRTS